MSQNQARSWRPEKKTDRKNTRRIQIALLFGLLLALLTAVLVLVLRPAVPPLHFVVIDNSATRPDENDLSLPSFGQPRPDLNRFLDFARGLRDVNPAQVGEVERFKSAAEFLSRSRASNDHGMLVYCHTELVAEPDREQPDKVVLQLVSYGSAESRVNLHELLNAVGQSSGAPRVLLLDIAGRQPGLHSGLLTAELPELIRAELRVAEAKQLTVICSCDSGERSWPWMSTVSSGLPSGSAQNVTSGRLSGTAFSHFLMEALENGQANTVADLHSAIRSQVQSWVDSTLGESQTVWIDSGSPLPSSPELLARMSPPKRKPAEGSNANTNVSTTEGSADKDATENQKSAVAKTSADVTPDERLQQAKQRMEQLTKTTVPVLNPAEWLHLRAAMQSAERLILNNDITGFEELMQNVLRSQLNALEQEAGETSVSASARTVRDWILTPVTSSLTPEQTRMLKTTLDDFAVEPSAVPSRLPGELSDNAALRGELVRLLLRDFEEFAESADSLSTELRDMQLSARIVRLQNLIRKWPQEVIPAPAAELLDVISAVPQNEVHLILKPLIRLTRLRIQALTLASGRGIDGAPLRQAQWGIVSAPGGIEAILTTLHAAERWLCVGADAAELAADRLDTAARELNRLLERTEQSGRLARVGDAQKSDLLPLIEFLALRLEQTSLPEQEQKQVVRMGLQARDGTVTADEFPSGQLDSIGFTRNHVQAMFALTRDFHAAGQEPGPADLAHLDLLQQYVRDESQQRLPAADRLALADLLNTDSGQLFSDLPFSPQHPSDGTKDVTSRSGIWLSFFSLRLADALAHKRHTDQWQVWSELAGSLEQSAQESARRHRTRLASALRSVWSDVIRNLTSDTVSTVFVSDSDVLAMIRGEAARRLRTTAKSSLNLYLRLRQTMEITESDSQSLTLTLPNPQIELSPDYTCQVPWQNAGGTMLYVLNTGLTVSGAGTTQDRNWHRVVMNAADRGSGQLSIQVQQSPTDSVRCRVVPVDAQGVPGIPAVCQLQPPADNAWEIETWLVEEGKPDRSITLQILTDQRVRRLRLLPSTFDAAANGHKPLNFRWKLRRLNGVSQRVRLRALHTGTEVVAWNWPDPLTFPEGSAVVDIPLMPPALPAPTQPPPAGGAAAPAVPVILDLSRGITFEITPDDLPRKVTSQFTVLPRVLEPEQILERPVPVWNSSTDTLEIPLRKLSGTDSGMIFPNGIPATVEPGPALQEFIAPGTSLKSLNADGEVFRIGFNSKIRQALSSGKLEFGLSVAGIPHAWWWKLSDNDISLLVDKPDVRIFLAPANETEAPPVRKSPDLLYGGGWAKARLQAEAMLHGDLFEDDWLLHLQFRRVDSDAVIRVKDPSFEVRTRFRETVRVQPGENGLWQTTTQTESWAIPAFAPDAFQLQNGSYQLEAIVEKRGDPETNAMSRTPLILDDTAPVFTENDIRLAARRTDIRSQSLNGSIRVTDEESAVARIRAGLNPDAMVPVSIVPGNRVVADFRLTNRAEFPKLEQKEIDNEQTMLLLVEVTNTAGLTTLVKKSVTFYLPGKPAPMVQLPGTIKVLFKSKSKYNVTLSGPVSDAKQDVTGSAEFPMLPPGKYSVSWKPVQGTLGGGSESVTLPSGKTVTAGPGK